MKIKVKGEERELIYYLQGGNQASKIVLSADCGDIQFDKEKQEYSCDEETFEWWNTFLKNESYLIKWVKTISSHEDCDLVKAFITDYYRTPHSDWTGIQDYQLKVVNEYRRKLEEQK